MSLRPSLGSKVQTRKRTHSMGMSIHLFLRCNTIHKSRLQTDISHLQKFWLSSTFAALSDANAL